MRFEKLSLWGKNLKALSFFSPENKDWGMPKSSMIGKDGVREIEINYSSFLLRVKSITLNCSGGALDYTRWKFSSTEHVLRTETNSLETSKRWMKH